MYPNVTIPSNGSSLFQYWAIYEPIGFTSMSQSPQTGQVYFNTNINRHRDGIVHRVFAPGTSVPGAWRKGEGR